MRNYILLFTIALFISSNSYALAEDATQIMNKADIATYYPGSDGKAKVHMEIINNDGSKRIREMAMLRKDIKDGGDQLFFIYFIKPNDVRNMTFLVKKQVDKDDDRWLFIPSIKMVKRLAASDARSAFVGSDYTYEDISGRHPDKDRHEYLGEEKINDRMAWVIKNSPKEPLDDYSWRKTWVDKETYLVLQESYFDDEGVEVRRFNTTGYKKVGKYWIGTAGTMVNLETNHKSTAKFSDVQIDIGIPDKVFTQRSLKSPPKKWIR